MQSLAHGHIIHFVSSDKSFNGMWSGHGLIEWYLLFTVPIASSIALPLNMNQTEVSANRWERGTEYLRFVYIFRFYLFNTIILSSPFFLVHSVPPIGQYMYCRSLCLISSLLQYLIMLALQITAVPDLTMDVHLESGPLFICGSQMELILFSK